MLIVYVFIIDRRKNIRSNSIFFVYSEIIYSLKKDYNICSLFVDILFITSKFLEQLKKFNLKSIKISQLELTLTMKRKC